MDVATIGTIKEGRLTVRSEATGTTHLIALVGEIDMSNAETLDEVLDRVEGSGAHKIVVDLSQLEFIDATGLGVLLVAARRSAVNGERLSFRHGGPQVERVLALTGIAGQLRFEA